MKTLIQIIFLVSFFHCAMAQAPNQALNFDGVDDYVSLNASTTFTNNSWSIEFWAKKTIGASGVYVISRGSSIATNQYMHIGWSGATTFKVGFFGNDLDVVVADDGLWHNWVIAYDDNAIVGSHNRFLYRDGTLIGSDEASNYEGSAVTEIGRAGLFANSNFNGSIDKVAFFLFNKDSQTINDQMFCESNQNSLVGLYDFQDDPSGTTLASLDGNPIYSGTLHNFALSGSTSNWTNDTPYEIPHFTAAIPDQLYNDGEDITLTSNYQAGDCNLNNPSFQWYKDGIAIPGETSVDLEIINADLETAGEYYLEVDVSFYNIFQSNTVTISKDTDFTASQLSSDYFIDVDWTLPIMPCLLDNSDSEYDVVTVQLLSNGSQIDFQTFDMDQLDSIYLNNEPIVGNYRDFVGPNQTRTYTINVFHGLLGNFDADCFGLTTQGSTLPMQDPEFIIDQSFSEISIGYKNISDLATSFEIYRDNVLIHTDTDPLDPGLDTFKIFEDKYKYNGATSLKSGKSYEYQVKMVSSLVSEIKEYDLGSASTLNVNLTHVGGPINTEKVDLLWSDQNSLFYDKIEIRRDNKLQGVKLSNADSYSDFKPFFGDSIDYQLRFIKEDTIRADFSTRAYLAGNGVISGRVVTQEGLFPVEGVNIMVTRKTTEEQYSAITNPSGQFSFTNLPYGLLDSFELTADKGTHTFVYPRKSIGLSSNKRNVLDALILDNFKYLTGSASHTISSFSATPVINGDKVELQWSMTTNAPSIFIDLIRNGEIIYSSTSMADLTGSFTDLLGTPGEETKYAIRIYTISGSTVSSKKSEQEIIFPEVSKVADANFSASEEQIPSFVGSAIDGTGNVVVSWSHTSDNFDNFRIYRNDVLIAELENADQQYIDNNAPFDSSLTYAITVTRIVGNTTYETKTPTIAPIIDRDPMPAPSNVMAFQQVNDPSILVNWYPPNEILNDFDFTGFFIYRNDELIATRYGSSGYFTFDRRAFGETGIIYSVSLFKHTESGIVESERVEAAPVDFPLAASVPSFTNTFIESQGEPNSINLQWDASGNLSSNIDHYLLTWNDVEVARLPPYEGSYTHYPASGSSQVYKLYVVNQRDNIDYISSTHSEVTVNFTPTNGTVYPPQNFKATTDLANHVVLTWEYLDFIPSQFILYRNSQPIDTLPVGSRTYYDYNTPNGNFSFRYTIRAFQENEFSGYVGNQGALNPQRFIYGTVLDNETKEGIPNVAIEYEYFSRKVIEAYTDSSGYYSFLSPKSYQNFAFPIRALRNSTVLSQTMIPSTEETVRVDFIDNIPDRPATTGQSEIEYVDNAINPYTLHGDISWRSTNVDYDGVEVYRGLDLIATVLKEDGNIYRDTLAVPGIEYPYLVRTYKEDDDGLSYSSFREITSTYLPVAPVIDLTATPQPNTNQVLVQWSHLFEHADGYIVSVNGNPTANVDADSLFLFYDSLGVAGQEYTYQLKAYKIVDSKPYFSEEKEVSAIFPKAAPVVDLQVSIPVPTAYALPLTLNHVLIDWDYLGSSVEQFNVFRDGKLIATLPSESTSFEDYKGIPLSSVTYGVSAVINQDGNRNESLRMTKDIIFPDISQPSDFGLLFDVDGAVSVLWNYHAPTIDKFIISASADGGLTSRTFEYTGELYLMEQQFHIGYDRDGTPGQTLQYRVAAVSVRNGIEYISPSILIGSIAYPYPPNPIVDASDGLYDRAIDVSWSVPAESGIDAFRLRRYDNSGGIWTEIDTFSSDVRNYFDQFATGQEIADSYIYYLSACRLIDGVMTCYDQSEGIDNGSVTAEDGLSTVTGPTGPALGRAVDVHGDWMIAGNSFGEIKFFQRTGNDWMLKQTINPANISDFNDGFADAVAIWDDLAVVGIPLYDKPNLGGGSPTTNTGALMVYKRVGDTWFEEEFIENTTLNTQLGTDVDIENNNIVASRYETSSSYIANLALQGAFEVHKRPNSCGTGVCATPYEEITVNAVPSSSNPVLSWLIPPGYKSITIEGNAIMIGIPDANPSNNTSVGAVGHYTISGSNAVYQNFFSGPAGASEFGRDLDADGNRLAVTATTATNLPNGLTAVYELSGSTWIEQTILSPTIANAKEYGYAVRFVDDRILVSEASLSFGAEAKVYLYQENTSGSYDLIQSPNISDTDDYRAEFHNNSALSPDPYWHYFGTAISMTSERVIIADPAYQSPVQSDPQSIIHLFNIFNPQITDLTASDGTQLHTKLDWSLTCDDCSSDYVDHFNIYRDTELIAEVPGTLDQFIDNLPNLLSSASAAIAGQIYVYSVAAVAGTIGEGEKVADQGYSKRNGKISGHVYVDGTNSGVPGATIEVRGVDPLTSIPYTYSTMSQSDGSFVLSGLFVTTEDIEYKIIPSFGDNDLQVNGTNNNPDIQNLSIEVPTKQNILIFDKTAFVITGHATNNVSQCGIEGLKVKYYQTINGLETQVDSTLTDEDGLYSILVKPTLPNLQQIKIKIDNLKITTDNQANQSDTIQYEFLSPQMTFNNFSDFPMSTTLDFEESLTYPISIFVQNACQNPVADQPIKLRISSLDGCLETTAQTNSNGQLTLNLPPKDYLIAVESLVGSGITNYENSAIDYLKLRQYNFDLLAIHTEAGGADTLPTIDPVLFEYHRATSFVFSTSFDRYRCDDPMQPAIITQGDSHSMNVSLTENHTSGESCAVFGGYIRVLNPAAAGATVDTLVSSGGAFPNYSFTVGPPNLVSPYVYGISFQYFSEDDNFLGQRVLSVIAEGQRQLPGTGIITEANRDEAGNLLFPLLVLRDPPGDGSYSAIQSGSTITKTLEIADESSGGFGFHLESKFTFGTGLFANIDFLGGGGNASSKSYEISVTTEQEYSTSDSEEAVGRGADVIVGSGISQQYGLARSLFFEDDNNCEPVNKTDLTFGTGGFESTYSYTIDFIEGLIEGYLRDSILIEQGALTYIKPDGDEYTTEQSRVRVLALITAWKEMIHYHDVETVPHYVLCSDFSYRDGSISPEAEAAYDGWRQGFCTLIGSYQGDTFIMDDEIDWTPNLINAYNNTVAFTDKLKDPLEFIDNGSLNINNYLIESNNLSITTQYHNLLGNQLKSAEVFDISGNVSFERSVTAQQSGSTSKSFSRFFTFDFAGGLAGENESYVGVGFLSKLTAFEVKAGVAIKSEAKINVSKSQAEDNQTTISYLIYDDDPEDQITFIALQAPLQDQTPYFIRLGGLSSCPAEEALTVSQDNAPLLIDDFDMKVVIDPEDESVTDKPNPSFNVEPDEAEVFEIKISNEGPTGLVRDAQVFLDLASNPKGAIVKIGGSDLNGISPIYSVPFGGSLTLFLTVERPPNTPFYNFEDLRVGIKPACGGEAEYIELSVFFKSPCSDVSLTMPLDHYVVNRISPNVLDDAEVIPFEIRDYDSSPSSNLEYVQLQYRRLGNNTGWQNVPSPEGRFSKETLFNSDSGQAPGDDPEYFSEWDITGLYNLIPDGDYLVRAQAFCATSGINFSNEVNVNVQRSELLVTGYPEPADKIWTVGDEISSTFSTDIDCGLLNLIDSIGSYLTLYDMETMMEVPFTYVCQNDKLTIVPTVQMSTLDGHMIRATYSGILNLAGNVAKDIVWDFKVVTTDVDWSDDIIELTLYQDELETVSTSIFNTIGNPISGLSISGGSSLTWLMVNPSSSITVPSGGLGVDLTFDLDGVIPTGDYSTTLMIDGLGGNRTPELMVMLHVIERPPFPEINNTFTDSMQMVLNWAFTHDNIKSTDISDAIYVYKDGQLRGGGYITAIGNFYHTKITVYGNADDEGELLDFVVWNADELTAYSAIGSTEIPFEANTSRGLIPDPEVILISDDLFEIAKRIYVDQAKTTPGDGLTWATAFSDLQDGIAVAYAGDEIWIAEGTYYPTSGGDRSESFNITEAISIYGGFVNGMDELSDRTGGNTTALSGDLLIPNVVTDNSFHVITTSSSDLLLDGLTVRDGNADVSPDDKGGCIYNTGTVTLRNCKASNGNASSQGTLIYNNGQMIIDGGTYTIPAVPTVSNLYNDSSGQITIRQNVGIKK